MAAPDSVPSAPNRPGASSIPAAPRFDFARDTFAFANQLVWQYRFHPVTGAMTFARNHPPPDYSHRCFVLVRVARQFFYHARFQPSAPQPPADVCRALLRQVLARSPRRASPDSDRVLFPGFAGLREFSQVCEPLLKSECGGAWQSYFLRSHWRMVLPVWASHQRKTALRLKRHLQEGGAPAVHIFRFPKITINHGLLLFAASEQGGTIEFAAYDPNIPERPVALRFEHGPDKFTFPPTPYFGGGPVRVIEIFAGGLY